MVEYFGSDARVASRSGEILGLIGRVAEVRRRMLKSGLLLIDGVEACSGKWMSYRVSTKAHGIQAVYKVLSRVWPRAERCPSLQIHFSVSYHALELIVIPSPRGTAGYAFRNRNGGQQLALPREGGLMKRHFFRQQVTGFGKSVYHLHQF